MTRHLYPYKLSKIHRLNMDLDLQSLFGLHVHSCTHWLRPCNNPPSPRIWAQIRGRLGQPRKTISLCVPCDRIYSPSFLENKPKPPVSISENERFGLVFAKTGSINSGTGKISWIRFQTNSFWDFALCVYRTCSFIIFFKEKYIESEIPFFLENFSLCVYVPVNSFSLGKNT